MSHRYLKRCNNYSEILYIGKNKSTLTDDDDDLSKRYNIYINIRDQNHDKNEAFFFLIKMFKTVI